MKYTKKTALGDAGEFYFAYQVAKVLKWPCRLFDIDIGIDAQVETMVGDESTGKFVAFQIKTSDSDHKFRRYVTSAQLKYWKGLGVPVFIVLVDMGGGDMYLHHIGAKNRYRLTKKGNRRIDFNPSRDRFTEASAVVIRDASDKAALREITQYLRKVLKGSERISFAVAGFEEYPDPPAVIDLVRDRVGLLGELSKARALAHSYRLGIARCSEAQEVLNCALEMLREYAFKNNLRQTWDDVREGNGDIGRFLDE